MGFWRKSAAGLFASVVIAGGGVVVSAGPASAAQACPDGNLCLYASSGFTSMKMRTVQTHICFALSSFQLVGDNQIMSYRNNLPVKAALWHTSPVDREWQPDGTIAPGAFSSNTGGNFNRAVVVCTGGRSPYWPGI
ncbi:MULTISPECIES: peptidase inhibitor family I36 protein [unclassified Streptomyces]|uniref:peptidase inhibitor family I36 protein n=1 Tax=unclassified Streptomyces TaxID=2593676 RepID=UPI0038212054